jgi:D-alanyl-D-alanine carboxypeptidase
VLIGVVLHSTATKPGERFTDARRMLSWGFSVLAASAARTARMSRPDR